MRTEATTQEILDLVKSGKNDREVFIKIKSKLDSLNLKISEEQKTILRTQFLENIDQFINKDKSDIWHNFKKFISKF